MKQSNSDVVVLAAEDGSAGVWQICLYYRRRLWYDRRIILSILTVPVLTVKKGINLCFVRLLIEQGCSVMIADLQLRPEARQLVGQHPFIATDDKPGVLFQKTDVASWPQLTAAWRTALEKFPSVDIVVAGAGIFEPRWSSFWEAPRTENNQDSVSRDDADADPGHYAVLDVNLVSPIRISQLAIGHW